MGSKSETITEDARSTKDAYAVRESTNISAVKGFSALIVMAGHFGTGIPNYWVVVAVGMLVFTISSGYFTWLRYHGGFRLGIFWRRKLVRLIPRLLVIEFFLLALFILQGWEGLWSWDTAMYIIPGLPGFLAWFHVPNQSPYGAGMWFLSLLLIFYLVYPLLKRLYQKIGSFAATAGGLLCLFALHRAIVYGHALWLTAAGFLLGMFLASRQLRPSAVVSLIVTLAFTIIMVASHAIFKFDAANFFYILTVAMGGILFIREINLPKIVTHVGGLLSGILLEIYLLHPYLLVKPTGIYRLDQGVSVALVLLVATGLAWFTKRVTQNVKSLQ